MQRLAIWIDSNLVKEFKAKVVLEGKTMKDVLTEFIKNYLKD